MLRRLAKMGYTIPTMMIALVGMFGMAGCGGGGGSDAESIDRVIINAGAEPRSLDPSISTDVSSAYVMNALFAGLTKFNSDDEVEGDIAESWTHNEDHTVYTFKLRDSNWSNGDPVTAQDFYYTWVDRMLNVEVASQYVNMLYFIKNAEAYYNLEEGDTSLTKEDIGIKVIDDKTLEVTLEKPNPKFPDIVAHHSYYPTHQATVEANPDGWANRAETLTANGAFKLKKYNIGRSIVCEHNASYWDSENVAMDEVEFRMISEPGTALVSFERGEIDVTQTVPPTDIERMREEEPESFNEISQVATYYAAFNTKREPFDNVLVRKALARAVNRQGIIDNVVRGGQTPAFHLAPPVLYDTPPEPMFEDQAYEEAKELLAEAGYPDGEGFPEFEYLYNTQESHKLIGEVLQADWRKHLGINMKLRNMEFKVLLDERREGNFDLTRAGWVGDYYDPMTFLELFESTNEHNDGKFEDAEYDALLEEIRVTGDPEKREELLLAAERRLMETQPFVPIYFYKKHFLVDPQLGGYKLNCFGFFDVTELYWKNSEATETAAAE